MTLDLLQLYWLAIALGWAMLSYLAWRLWQSGMDGRRTFSAESAERQGVLDGSTRASTPGPSGQGVAPDPAGHRTGRRSFLAAHPIAIVAIILLVAAAARIPLAIGPPPRLSDDLYRYLFDGATLAAGHNPYRDAPADLLQRPAAEFPVLPDDLATGLDIAAQVNHPHLVTIYQPTSQWMFAALWSLRWDQDGIDTFRVGFAIFDLLIVAMLLAKLAGDGRSLWWAALYAWHPLAITEIAQSGHQDAIGIAMLLAALLCVDRAVVLRSVAAAALAGVMLALSIAVKPPVGAIGIIMAGHLFAGFHQSSGATPSPEGQGVPSVVDRGGHTLPCGSKCGTRAAVSFIAAVVLTLLGLYLPYALMPGGLTGMIETARTFTDQWSFNSPIHQPLTEWLGSHRLVTVGLGLVTLVVMIVTYLRRRDAWEAAGVTLLTGLLFSSTVHPWYLLWALPFVVVRFSLVTWVWSLTITFSYIALINPAGYHVTPAATFAQYSLLALAIATTVAITLGLHRPSSNSRGW